MKIVLAFIVGVAACNGGGGNTVAIGDFGTSLSKALCAKAFTCCTQAQVTALFQSSTTLTTTDQCDMYEGGIITTFGVDHIQASIAAGRVKYDGDAAGACIDTIPSVACAGLGPVVNDATAPPGCSSFLMPLVASGGGCTQSYECTTGYCQGAVTVPTPKDGACMTPPGMGQTCQAGCAAGLYCDFSTTMTCKPLQADGSTCLAGNECTSGGCTAGLCGAVCTSS